MEADGVVLGVPELVLGAAVEVGEGGEALGGTADDGQAQGGSRRALAVVSDDPTALADASELVDLLGFDAVAVPEERAGLFRPDGRLFGAWLDAEQLASAVV